MIDKQILELNKENKTDINLYGSVEGFQNYSFRHMKHTKKSKEDWKT